MAQIRWLFTIPERGVLSSPMPPSADRFRGYLAVREPVLAASTGTLFERSSRSAVSIGLTDRRLLCVTDDGQVLTVDYDAICTIQSRPRTTYPSHERDYQLLLGSGGVIAFLGGLGVVVFATSILVSLLAFVAVGGVISAEYLRRRADECPQGTVTEVAKYVPDAVDGAAVQQWTQRVTPVATDEDVLLVGTGGIALVSFAGLVLLASSGHVVLGVLMLVGGLALVDYSARHRNDLDEVERRHEVDVHIDTSADRTIHLRSNPSAEFVQELNRVTFMDDDVDSFGGVHSTEGP